jgi:hypothetical protein
MTLDEIEAACRKVLGTDPWKCPNCGQGYEDGDGLCDDPDDDDGAVCLRCCWQGAAPKSVTSRVRLPAASVLTVVAELRRLRAR